jgi:AcrR family transcriptional regulator
MSEARRDEIIECFGKHVCHYGFKKTSINDIAKELKISKKTIYSLFDSKEQLFYNVILKHANKIKDSLQKDLANHRTNKRTLEHLLELIFKHSVIKGKKKDNDLDTLATFKIAELAFKDACTDITKEAIEKGIERGEFKRVDIPLTLDFISAIIAKGVKSHMDGNTNAQNETKKAIFKLLE